MASADSAYLKAAVGEVRAGCSPPRARAGLSRPRPPRHPPPAQRSKRRVGEKETGAPTPFRCNRNSRANLTPPLCVLSQPLAQAMAAAVVAQPKDMVEFIGDWMVNHVATQQRLTEVRARARRICFWLSAPFCSALLCSASPAQQNLARLVSVRA